MSSITRDYLVIGRSEIDAMVKQKLADIVMSGHSKNGNARDLAALVDGDATIEVFRCISEMIPVIVGNVVDDGWKKLEPIIVEMSVQPPYPVSGGCIRRLFSNYE